MTRPATRFTTLMLVLMGFFLSTNVAQAQVSADIQVGSGDKTLKANTSLQVKAGDALTVEIFASSYTSAQGVEVTLQVSDIAAFVPVSGSDYATGASTEFPVVINSTSGTQLKMSAVAFGPTKTYSGDPKLVATMSLKLADTFTSATVTVLAVDFGAGAIDPQIAFSLTPPLNNLITGVSVTRRHTSARLTFRSKLDGLSSQVQYRVKDTTEWLTAKTTLETSTSDTLLTAVKALRTANVNIQRASVSALATALTTANISNTSEAFILAIKILDAALSSRIHEVNLTGLTVNTQYEYQIVATGIDGDLSPSRTGTFKTRLTPDVRPAAISGVNASITATAATLKWRTSRSSTTQYKIYTRTAAGARGTLVTESPTPSTTTGSTSHKATVQNLTSATEYEYELSTRLVGVDDLITDGTMTEAQATATEVGTFKTLSTLPPVALIRSPRVTRGTTNAQILVKANQPVTVFIDYGLRGSTRPSGDVPTGSDFDADPFYGSRFVSTEPQAVHTIELSGLETESRYRYRVTVYSLEGEGIFTTDPRGNHRYSRDFNFRTLADVPVPTITRGPTVRAWKSRAWFNVRTNVPTTMSLFYGTVGGTFGTPDEIEVPDVDRNGELVTRTHHRVLVSGLSGQTNYNFRMEFTNIEGETLTFPSAATKGAATKFQVAGSTGGFGTTNQDDITKPLITKGPTIVATTENSLTIEWTTDEPATSSISYGTSATALTNQVKEGEAVLTHQVTLTGLDTNTKYAFQVGSTDVSGNGPTQSTTAFGSTLAQADITAPKFTVAPTLLYTSDTVAEIKWNTDELSSGEFNFGTTATNLDQTRSIADDATEHVRSLTKLTPNTTYFYQVVMNDANGNGPTRSEVLSFKTAATADTQAPTISSVVATPLSTSAIITWKTDEIADGVVKFGTDASALSGNVSDISSVTDHRIILSNLTAATTYSFLVQSTDRSNNGPAASTQATFTTKVAGTTVGPTAPANLAARAGNGVVQLTWEAPPTDATSLVIERATGDGEFAPITTLDIATNFIDNNVVNDTAYRYRISANGLQGAGTASTATSAVTPSSTNGPSAPTLFAIQGTQTSPTIVINNSTPATQGDALSYTFQLSTMSDFSDVVTLEAVASGQGRASSDPAGVTAYTVDRSLTDGATYYYRVKANDGFTDSQFLTGSFKVNASAPAYPGDFDGDFAVGFPDFIQFVGAFNKTPGQDGYNAAADLTNDGLVGFPDFLAFVAVFNKKYIQGTTASEKPVLAVEFGKDTQAQFNLVGHFVQNNSDRELAVDVQLKDVTDLQGYGIQVNYDPTVLEFVHATDAGETFLKAGNRSADLFGILDHNEETGALYIASAITQGNAVSGAGTLGTLTFRLLDPNPQNADIQIAQGILFNPTLNGFIATNLGDRFSLVPTEFALENNFPNPFNPETTLRYALPEASQVTLSIYNVLGQEVVRLVDADQMPGFYAVRWDGKNALGHNVASGVYLYRIQAGEFNQTQKMLLLK